MPQSEHGLNAGAMTCHEILHANIDEFFRRPVQRLICCGKKGAYHPLMRV